MFWLIGASNQKLVADWPNFERLGENGQENIFFIILVHTRLHSTYISKNTSTYSLNRYLQHNTPDN